MLPTYFNLFRTNFPNQPAYIPVVPVSAIDWDLIQSLDPSIIDIQDEKFLKFVYNFPTYKVTNNDQNIIDHPLILRLFLLLQKSLSALTQIAQFYMKKVSKQQNEIKSLTHQMKDYKNIIESDKFDENKSKSEKCYACGQRFYTLSHLKQHIRNNHPHLMIPWKQILSNTYENKSEEIISNLRIDINNLRQYISEQDDRFQQNISYMNRKYQNLKNRWIKLKEKQNLQQKQNIQNMANTVTVIEIQPPYGPWNTLKEHPKLDIENNQKIEYEDYYDEQYHMMEDDVKYSIQKQAAIIMNKKVRNYHMIHDQIRINLEREIPMPVTLGSHSQIERHEGVKEKPQIAEATEKNQLTDSNPFCISDDEQSKNNGAVNNEHEKTISVSGQQNVFELSDNASTREMGELSSVSSSNKVKTLNDSSIRYRTNQLVSDYSSEY